MIVTEQEYKSMFKEIDGITFTPQTNLIVEEDDEVDGEKVKVFKYEIIKSADEAYQEWLENKPKPKEPTEVEQLQKQLLETQNMLLELQYKLTNKDLTNNLK